MPKSGIQLTPDAKKMLAEFGSCSCKLTWILLDICHANPNDADTSIRVHSCGHERSPYELVLAKLSEMKCGYAVYLHELSDDEAKARKTSPQSYPVFVRWADDCEPIKRKMIYTSSGDTVKCALNESCKINMQCNDVSDFERDTVFQEIKRKNPNHF